MNAATTPADARRIAAQLARRHDENFPVLFALLPRELRMDMRALYAFCRTVDDLGDAATGDRMMLLDGFADDLREVWHGRPEHPVLLALIPTVRRHGLDPEQFERLIEANRMDQRCRRWETHGDLLEYCRHSATPVGRLVLAVLGVHNTAATALSDHVCIGLQLVNFWQDIARDLADNDRVYLPVQDMERFGVDEDDLRATRAAPPVRRLVEVEVERARAHLVAGSPLVGMVPRRARLDIRMFIAGGLAVCDAIARQGYDTLASRPAPGRLGRARIVASALMRALVMR